MKKFFEIYFPFYKSNLALAVPVMISQLGQSVVMMADNIMTGVLGTVPLAATSFANAVFIIGFVLAQGIAFGATPLVGPNYATGKHRKSANLFQHSFIVNLCVALVVGTIMYSVSFYMDRLGQDADVCALAVPYYRVLVVSLVPYMIFLSFKQFLEGVGNTRYAMIITIICNLINILFNYLLIFGKCGFTEMGVTGAGVSSLISRICMPLLYVVLFIKRDSLRRYFYFFRRKDINWADLKKLSSVGLPIGAQMSVECGVFGISTIMAGWFGAVQQASHQIALSVSTMTFMVVCGIGSASTILVSHCYGRGEILKMKRSAYATIQITFVYSLLCCLTVLLTRFYVPRIFSSDSEVLGLAAVLFVFMGIYQIADAMQSVLIGILRGMADVTATMLITLFSYVFVDLPVSYVVSVRLGYGAIGIWIGFCAGLYTLSLLLAIRFFLKTRHLK